MSGGNVSPIEAAWTLVACLGLLFSGWLTLAGWRDLAEVRAGIARVPPIARAWGPRWWVGLSAVVANAALCLVWLGFAIIGWISMQFPPPPPTTEQSVSNVWAGWVLIATELILALVQAWHLFVSERVTTTSREQHP
jgi:hypothetical protein